MKTQTNIDPIASLQRFARAASATAAAVGCLVLLGWAFDVTILKTFYLGGADMKANAALALVLSALSLWLLSGDSDPRLLLVARACAAVVVLIGLLTISEYLLGRDLGIDQFWFNDPAAETGRMDPATAVVILLLGAELSLLGAAIEARIVQSIALATGALSLLALSGYLYSLPALYGVGSYAPIAPHAAACFLILSLGVLCARPGEGLLAALAGDNTGGLSALRWLPGAVGIPLLLGYLTLLGQRRGFYGAEVGLALFALSNAVFFTVVILRSARSFAQTESGRRRSERRLQRDLQRLRALRESELAIPSAPELGDILDILFERIDLVLPFATAATVRLLNRETGELEPLRSRHRNEENWTLEENRVLGARSKKIIETKTPLAIGNLQHDPQANKPMVRKAGVVSYVGVPVVVNDEALGILGVYTGEEHDFARDEIEFLRSAAAKAAQSIYQGRLYEEFELSKKELQLANANLRNSLKLLPGIYSALAPLTASGSVSETIEGTLESFVEATGADAVLIRIWKKDTGAAVVAGHRGFSDDHVRQMKTGLLGGALEWVVKQAEPIVAPDIAAEPRFKTKLQQQAGFASCALLPLKIHGSVCGVIHLASRRPGHFDEGQKDLLVAIAQQMGVAIENRELFDHLKDSRDELEKASKVKDEFLSVMSHELRTPLSVVMGYAGMIKEKLLGEINPQQEDALQKLLVRGNDQLTMINAIMQITQLESRALVLERHLVNLGELLGHLKSDYAISHTKEQVALVWDYPSEPLAIVTDGGKLKEILVNLINNAIKFTPQGSVTVYLRLTEDPRRKWVELKVADSGIGIAAEHFGVIFDKFYQVDSSETRLYGGTGLGLYIVKHFTEFLGGRLDVASESGKGSTFTVRIPYAT
ncbi:MAG: GAF domain-containing protein [Candidatus Binatia bacterium]